MVNNLDIYLMEHKERLQQCSNHRLNPQVKRGYSLRLPGWKQLKALLLL